MTLIALYCRLQRKQPFPILLCVYSKKYVHAGEEHHRKRFCSHKITAQPLKLLQIKVLS